MNAHTYSLINIGSHNEPTLPTLKGIALDPSPLGEMGEVDQRRLVEVLGPPAPEDRVVSVKLRSSPFDSVEVLGVPAGEDGQD